LGGCLLIMIISEFLFWGMFGIVLEVCFTALLKLFKEKKLDLTGHVSFWMFPVYAIGLTYGFDIIEYLIPWVELRYILYPFWIWAIEFVIGYPLLKIGIRLWDYRYWPGSLFQWKGIISYAHFPLWILFGIIVEAFK